MNLTQIEVQGKYHQNCAPSETTQALLAEMLTEIAAQLCEVNGTLKLIAHPLLSVDRDEKTLRDEFAMVALRGAFMCDPTDFWKGSGKIDSPSERQAIVQRAYLWADSMMGARKGQGGK